MLPARLLNLCPRFHFLEIATTCDSLNFDFFIVEMLYCEKLYFELAQIYEGVTHPDRLAVTLVSFLFSPSNSSNLGVA